MNIPKEAMNEIDFMLGSIEECQSDYLKPILEAHGFISDGWIDNPTEELINDIYQKLFVTGIIEPMGEC